MSHQLPDINMTSTRILLIPILGLSLAACEELPSDPTPNQQIVGEWKASKIGTAFAPATSIDVNFKTSGDATFLIDGVTVLGTYTTTASGINADIREISLSITGLGDMIGIYTIVGSQMKLELVPDPFAAGDPPTPMEGIGSTKIGGVRTSTYVTELQRK